MIEHRTENGQLPGTVQPQVPAGIRNACWVMYAGAVASAIHGVVAVVTTGATKTAIHKKDPHLAAGTLGTLTSITVIATAVLALIGAVLFIWIARACRRGENWARITGTVFAFLAVLLALYDVSAGRSAASLIVSFVVAALGLASVAILWQPSASAYFRHFKRPQF